MQIVIADHKILILQGVQKTKSDSRMSIQTDEKRKESR